MRGGYVMFSYVWHANIVSIDYDVINCKAAVAIRRKMFALNLWLSVRISCSFSLATSAVLLRITFGGPQIINRPTQFRKSYTSLRELFSSVTWEKAVQGTNTYTLIIGCWDISCINCTSYISENQYSLCSICTYQHSVIPSILYYVGFLGHGQCSSIR
jgi:hypothetical protein